MKKLFYLCFILSSFNSFAQTEISIINVGKNCAKILLEKTRISENYYDSANNDNVEVKEVERVPAPFDKYYFTGPTSQFFLDAMHKIKTNTELKVVNVNFIYVQGEYSASYYYLIKEDKKSCFVYPNFSWVRNSGNEE